jgi:Tol biopolymer transport system component
MGKKLRLSWAIAALALAVAHSAGAQLSLKPTRTFDHVLSEGTWMQPDVSPDGRTIIFDLLGDIYAVDITGGPARPILIGQPFETHPVFSPDGRRVAFVSDRSGVTNLWIANADGSDPRQLSHDDALTIYSSPAWAPDGRSVYVSRLKHAVLAFELWSFPADGGAGVQITKAGPENGAWDDRVNALGAVVSPDGRFVYYARKTGHTWTEKDPPNWQLARRDLQTGAETTIIESAGGAMHPALSHDGRRLAYASRWGQQDGIRLRDLDTGADRWLAFPIDRDAQEQGYYADLTPRFSFAPGDKFLVASVGGKIGRIDVVTGAWTPIPFTAHVQLGLGPLTRVQQHEETGPIHVRVIQSPEISPDGRTLAFTALGGLYVQANAPGASPRRLSAADVQAFQPHWSPDGRRIVYVTWNANAGGAIWTIPAVGGRPTRLTRDVAYYTEPVFSADGRTIAALRASQYERLHAINEISQARPTDLIRLPATGGAVSLIAHAEGAHMLAFAAEPDRLFYHAGDGVHAIRLDGSDERRLFSGKVAGPSEYYPAAAQADEIRLDPSGRRALVRSSIASELYLVDVPPANGSVPDMDVTANPGAVKLTRIGLDSFDWADEGRTITWSLGNRFFRLPLDQVDRSSPGASEARAATTVMDVVVPRDVPDGTVVLRGATVVTMRGNEVIVDADVVVTQNRIAAIGKRGAVAIPAGAAIREVAGKFIVPGFVDAHAHWFETRRTLQDDQAWDFLVNLAFGVTSGMDPQSFTSDIFIYHDMIDAGLTLGPRTYSTGPGVFHNVNLRSEADAEAVLTRYRDYWRTRNIKSYMVGDRQERQYLLEAAKKLGMMPTTEGASDLDLDLTHAIDGYSGNEHALPVTPLHEDIVRLFAESRTSYVPTLGVLYGGEPAFFDMIIHGRLQDDPKFTHFVPPGIVSEKLRNRHWMPDEAQSYNLFAADALHIQRAGGVVGLGSHGEIQGLGFHWEMRAFASGGATPLETLRAATMGSAEAIGRSEEIGSIEPGKFADLLILDADPLKNINNVDALHWVMKNGRLYEAATLTEIWPRQKKTAPKLWFDGEAPAKTLAGQE